MNKTNINLDNLTEIVDIFTYQKDAINHTIDEIINLSFHVIDIQHIIKEIAVKHCVDWKNKSTFLGLKSTEFKNEILYYYIEILNFTYLLLNNISKVYPFFINNTYFLQQLSVLQEDLSYYINTSQEIIEDCCNICIKYLKLLNEYKNTSKRSLIEELEELRFRIIGHQLYRRVFHGFYYVPQMFFRSLLFLRQQWYEYEKDIALAEF